MPHSANHYVLHQAPQARGTLVILPGLNSGPYLFDAAVPTLGQHWNLLRIVPPGMGNVPVKSTLTSPYTTAKYAQYVSNLMAQVAPPGPLVIMGHSLGSYAAQELAKKLLNPRHHQHQAFAGLILVSSGPGQPATTQDIMRLQLKTGRNFWRYMQDIRNNPVEEMRHVFGQWAHQCPHDYEQFIQNMLAFPPYNRAAAAAQLSAGGLFSSYPFAHTLRIPTLCLHGEDDLLVSIQSCQMLTSLLPQAQLVRYPHTGHFPMLEVDHFYADVAQFLDALNLPQVTQQVSGKAHAQKSSSWLLPWASPTWLGKRSQTAWHRLKFRQRLWQKRLYQWRQSIKKQWPH